MFRGSTVQTFERKNYMSEKFEGGRCLICGYPSGHSPECQNNPQPSEKTVRGRVDIHQARDEAWEIRKAAVKRKAKEVMRNDDLEEGSEEDIKTVEYMIHAGKAEQPQKIKYDIAHHEYESKKLGEEIKSLEKAREKLKNL